MEMDTISKLASILSEVATIDVNRTLHEDYESIAFVNSKCNTIAEYVTDGPSVAVGLHDGCLTLMMKQRNMNQDVMECLPKNIKIYSHQHFEEFCRYVVWVVIPSLFALREERAFMRICDAHAKSFQASLERKYKKS